MSRGISARRSPSRAQRVRARWGRGKRRPSKRPGSPTGRRPLGRHSLSGSQTRQWEAAALASASGGVITIHLPSLRDVRVGWRLASSALFLVAALALGYLVYQPEYYVYDIELAGASLVPHTEVYLASGVDTDHIFWIDPARVQEKVAAMPGIESAQVSVDWPARVMVTVKERAPAVVWQQGGQSVWVDGQGVAFEQRMELPGLLPIEVDDADGPLTILPDEPVVPVAAIAGALQLKELRPNIELLHYDSLHGLSYQDGRGWRGYFGTGTNMDVKLLVYETLVDNLLSRQIRPGVVSVEHVDAPFYRR